MKTLCLTARIAETNHSLGKDNVIIVRLGHEKSPDADLHIFSDDISVYIEEAYKMLSHAPETQP